MTIIPRTNGAGGFTLFTPTEERLESGLYSKRYLEGQLAVALGGRVAEEIVYGADEITTGASNDLQQVSSGLIAVGLSCALREQLCASNSPGLTSPCLTSPHLTSLMTSLQLHPAPGAQHRTQHGHTVGLLEGPPRRRRMGDAERQRWLRSECRIARD